MELYQAPEVYERVVHYDEDKEVLSNKQEKLQVKYVKGLKCMISGLTLHSEMEGIVSCPYCGHFVKEKLLKEWLKENNICPVCRKRLQIPICPVIEFID